MMFRTICLRNPPPVTAQTDSYGWQDSRRTMASTVRTVDTTGVPAFWKAAKSWVPTNSCATCSMAVKSSGPTGHTKALRWGSRKPFSCQKV